MPGRTVISVDGHSIEVVNPNKAFENPNFTDGMRRVTIEETADAVATLMTLDALNGIIVPTEGSTGEFIEEYKRGLSALGVKDVDKEIAEAIERAKAQGVDALAKRALRFMGL